DPQNHIQQESEKHLDKNSFKHWATACLATKTNLTQKTQYGFQSRLDNYIYPKFADCNINGISSKSILDFLKGIENKGLYETAKRCKGIMSQVFRHGIMNGACANDP
ncbi:phage integrase central domain-containing protein, partial [Ostreibacterium oceani]|uniref:phage integrase central domain-containing protein n=1 Tax=Ostreibacterium oceani TaxID=2654998 RepID=UPI001C406419